MQGKDCVCTALTGINLNCSLLYITSFHIRFSTTLFHSFIVCDINSSSFYIRVYLLYSLGLGSLYLIFVLLKLFFALFVSTLHQFFKVRFPFSCHSLHTKVFPFHPSSTLRGTYPDFSCTFVLQCTNPSFV